MCVCGREGGVRVWVCDCSHVRVRPAEALTAVSLFDVEPCRIRPSPSGALQTACTHTPSLAHKHTNKVHTYQPKQMHPGRKARTWKIKVPVPLFTQEPWTHTLCKASDDALRNQRPQTFHHSQPTLHTRFSGTRLFNKHKCKSLRVPPLWGFCTTACRRNNAHTAERACRGNIGQSERIYSDSQEYRRGCVPFLGIGRLGQLPEPAGHTVWNGQNTIFAGCRPPLFTRELE